MALTNHHIVRVAQTVCMSVSFLVLMASSASAQTFSDVPTDHWAATFIESLAASGISSGCGNGDYCPDNTVSRAQMAVFLERGMRGSGYVPPAASGNVFDDVSAGAFAANFIEQFYLDGITSGCTSTRYCPDTRVSRDQMAVFLLRAKYGSNYSPPAARGIFADVPVGSFAAGWIEQLATEGVTSGCGNGNYCPKSDVTRAQMAVFLVRTFDLPMPQDTTPLTDAHLEWRVALPGSYSSVRPAVGPDGSVYGVDVNDNLAAVAPDGTVLWFATQAGSKGVDVGPDGTIYTGNEDWIKAYNPDGSLKWTFVQSPRAHAFHDVSVGPDGHVYALASSGMGVFSLDDTPTGPVLRWANPEPFVRLYVNYTEIAFGPTSNGGDFQLYFHVNGHTRAIRLSDGQSVFTVTGQNQRPQVSPFDGTWHVGDAAYAPNSALVWMFDFGLFSTAREPALGESGRHYAISEGQLLFAIDAGGIGRWSTMLDESVGLPDVDPTESMLLMPTSSTTTHPSGLKAVQTSNGSPLWRMEFPLDASGVDQHVDSGVAFSSDGGTAYVMTALASGSGSTGTYLNAVNIDPGIPSASTILRVTNIDMGAKSKGQSVSFTGIVTILDENRNPVSGVDVQATWTLPDGSMLDVTEVTNNSGNASFSLTGDGGLYWLTVTNSAKTDYVFDPGHSILNGGIAWF